tara:strand:+ start:3519 stop:5195 length:1677 start_codon:yes stop_codon:yes gene_type:complete
MSGRKININSLDGKGMEKEIDIEQIFFILIRNKIRIGLFILAGIGISGLYLITTKKVWQGEFQIVLENKTQERFSSSINQDLAKLGVLPQKENELKTEVEILKSPSVLLEIFEFVRSKKAFKPNSIKGLKFKEWRRNSLQIELEEETSVLNISYRDIEKKLIIPVLKKISDSYQEYSGKKRKRNIELGIEYFKDQIEIYKKRNLESIIAAQNFANKHDLSIKTIENKKDSRTLVNVEETRLEAANEIRLIDQQLKVLKDLEDVRDDQAIYLASTIGPLKELSLDLKSIEENIARSLLNYKESDKRVQGLLEEREFVIEILKKQAIGVLNAKKANATARLKAAERPQGVVLDYKLLLNNAARDKATLDQLENQYRSVLLEKARYQDPWELISSPTVLPFAVSPIKSRILVLGMLGGAFLGSVISLISERRKDIIYELTDINTSNEFPFLAELSISQNQLWGESIELILSGPLLDSEGSVAFLIIGEIDTAIIEKFKKLLEKKFNEREFIITKDIRDALKLQNLIIVVALEITRNKELLDARKKLELQKVTSTGILVIKN